MSRAVAFLVSACLLGCARNESGEVRRVVRSAATGPEHPRRLSDCEHIRTDLPEAKKPYPGAVTWSGTGALVAAVIGQSGEASDLVDGADGIVVWSVSDGVARKRYRIPAQAVAFTHKDERLAFSSDSETGVIDLPTDCAQRWKLPGPLVAWGPDDRTLFVAGGSGGVTAIDPTRGAALREWLAPKGSPRLVSLDASSTAVAIGDELHQVRTISLDLSRAEVVPGTTNAIANSRAVAIAPNGTMVASTLVEEKRVRYPPGTLPGASSTHKFFVRVFSLPDARVRATFPADPEALAFSPDSASLAMATMNDSRLSVRRLATNETRVLDDKVYFAQQVAWSPDGRSLALADWRGSVRLYDTVSGGPPRLLTP